MMLTKLLLRARLVFTVRISISSRFSCSGRFWWAVRSWSIIVGNLLVRISIRSRFSCSGRFWWAVRSWSVIVLNLLFWIFFVITPFRFVRSAASTSAGIFKVIRVASRATRVLSTSWFAISRSLDILVWIWGLILFFFHIKEFGYLVLIFIDPH